MARRKKSKRSPTSEPRTLDVRARARRPGPWLALLIALAAGGAAAFMWWPGQGVRREPGLNVLLVTIDTLRADAVGAYGHASARTPWMDRLAAHGVRFDDAHAHNVTTLPSHANILSGRYPLEHGVRDNAGFRFPPGLETLATVLKAQGYRTGAFVSAFPLDSRFGLDRGFDVYEDRFADAGPRPAFLIQERPGTATVQLARAWIDAQGDGPWFSWVHLYEPHFPYEPPEPYASQFRGEPYHGDVAAADAALHSLVEPIVSTGEAGRTLVVLTSDHGESLGEHGEATHGIFAYEASLKVPLILYQPALWKPRVVSDPARHIDLLPTILDALDLPVPPGLPGRSLLPLAAGRRDGNSTTYFEAMSGALNRGWAPLYGVIHESTKYIDLPIPELYDMRADAQEMRNLARSEPRRLAEMRTLLASIRSGDRGVASRPESAETRQRLASLGYVAGGVRTSAGHYTEDDDPKRLIALDVLLQEVVGLYLAGDMASALARCRELVARRPQMLVSLLHLGQLERESGNMAAAVEALRKAVALHAEDERTVAMLGTYLTEAGRAREAVDLLELYAARDLPDVDLLVAHGLALAKVGQVPAALAALARAREQDASNAMLLVHAGTVHLMAGDRPRARESFDAAVALNPRVARAHSSLGVMAAEDGRGADAVAHWKAAVHLDPGELDKLLALGMFHRQSGRTAEARLYLQFFAATAPPARFGPQIDRVQAWLKQSAVTPAAGGPGR